MQSNHDNSNNMIKNLHLQGLEEHVEEIIESLKLFRGIASLTEIERKILKELANRGPLCGYDFHLGGQKFRGNREAICSSRSWLTVRKSLLDKKLIRPIPLRSVRHYDRRGRRKDVYCLTLEGLILAANLGIIPIKDVIKDAGKNHINSLIFRKWNKILQFIPEECALAILDEAINKAALMTEHKPFGFKFLKEYKQMFKRGEKDIERVFTEAFLKFLANPSFCINLSLNNRAALINSDTELKKIFMQLAVQKVKYLKAELKWYKHLLSATSTTQT